MARRGIERLVYCEALLGSRTKKNSALAELISSSSPLCLKAPAGSCAEGSLGTSVSAYIHLVSNDLRAIEAETQEFLRLADEGLGVLPVGIC